MLKIQNSAESYCLAESEFSAPKCQNTLISAPPRVHNYNFIHLRLGTVFSNILTNLKLICP